MEGSWLGLRNDSFGFARGMESFYGSKFGRAMVGVLVVMAGLSGCSSAPPRKNVAERRSKGLFQVLGATPERGRSPAGFFLAQPPGHSGSSKLLRVSSLWPVSSEGYQWPLQTGVVSSRFGMRGERHHDGIDIQAPLGTFVRASRGGKVIYAGSGIDGYGNIVIIRHDKDMATVYAHHAENLVRKGQHVAIGTVLGRVGATGRASSPHLHFEVRRGTRALDPLHVLATESSVVASGGVGSERRASSRTF